MQLRKRGGEPQIEECSGFEAYFEVDFQFAVLSWLYSRLVYFCSTLYMFYTTTLININLNQLINLLKRLAEVLETVFKPKNPIKPKNEPKSSSSHFFRLKSGFFPV
jgi:hypothetical protein